MLVKVLPWEINKRWELVIKSDCFIFLAVCCDFLCGRSSRLAVILGSARMSVFDELAHCVFVTLDTGLSRSKGENGQEYF